MFFTIGAVLVLIGLLFIRMLSPNRDSIRMDHPLDKLGMISFWVGALSVGASLLVLTWRFLP